ncbi:MAG: hypothetical protein JWN40_5405 [Phycisphaerales bacterium]|nr:hypothetical protein [Phycisphaerales bacterium]
MLTLSIDEARAGMRLAVSIPHPVHPEQDLLTAGYTLDDIVLRKMRELGVTFLYVDYPPLADLDWALLPQLSPARKALYGQIKRSIESIQKHTRPQASYAAYYALTRQFVLSILQQGKQPIYLDELSLRLGCGAVMHAASVAHLSLMLGIGLETHIIRQRPRMRHDNARELLNLGVAGMLHDLGKSELPPHLQSATSLRPPESQGERQLWEAHPQIGYDMIRSEIDPTAAAAVRLHHQRFDGTGFPHHEADTPSTNFFEGNRIHVYGRVLFAADLYDRLSFRDDGRRRHTFEVLHLMRSRHDSWLDPEILAALPKIIPPFPPGMKIQLTDGTQAAVVAVSPKNPYTPMVRQFENDGQTLSGRLIDLAREDHLQVELAVGVPVKPFLPQEEDATPVPA